MPNIREISDRDWPEVWQIMQPVIGSGQTYPFACDLDSTSAREIWMEIPHKTYVAIDNDGTVLGTYYIKPNQPTLGAHVANCGYIVSDGARGKGVATAMCEHSQEEAVKLGYRTMQFNLVVKTNEAGVYLWQKLGFHIVGTLTGAFKHPEQGYIDAYVMYKVLVDNE